MLFDLYKDDILLVQRQNFTCTKTTFYLCKDNILLVQRQHFTCIKTTFVKDNILLLQRRLLQHFLLQKRILSKTTFYFNKDNSCQRQHFTFTKTTFDLFKDNISLLDTYTIVTEFVSEWVSKEPWYRHTLYLKKKIFKNNYNQKYSFYQRIWGKINQRINNPYDYKEFARSYGWFISYCILYDTKDFLMLKQKQIWYDEILK